MTVLNTGSTKKYAASWDNIFGGAKKKPATGKTSAAPKAGKKAAKKAAAKKTGKKAGKK
ncbi:MAG: hypothetical protein AB7O62_02530 [Pirellulales bacterium]